MHTQERIRLSLERYPMCHIIIHICHIMSHHHTHMSHHVYLPHLHSLNHVYQCTERVYIHSRNHVYQMCRESITRKASFDYQHKKQSGGQVSIECVLFEYILLVEGVLYRRCSV